LELAGNAPELDHRRPIPKEIDMYPASQELYEGEFDQEGEAFGQYEAGDHEFAFEGDFEGDFETSWAGEGEAGWAGEGPFTVEQEQELAAELLALSSEGELDHFLGKLFKRIAPIAGKIIRGPVGQQLTGLLKSTAKKALPLAGRAIGGYFGGAKGGAIGAQAGNLAGKIFGLELEGMSYEDQEFEAAQRFVRLAGDAAQKAAQAPPQAPPAQAARAALAAAARTHAPGLLKSAAGAALPAVPGSRRRRMSGRWVRRGNRILLLGV
jgi:hypothetical protein